MTPEQAYDKARQDGEPRDETRNAVCKSVHYAYYYALTVDKEPHDETRKAVRGSEWERKYNEWGQGLGRR